MRRYGLRAVALGYLLVVLLGPLFMVFWRTFENGFDAAWAALTQPETLHAFKLTLLVTAIAVPLNTVFGIVCALAIVRRRFPGKGLVNAFVDLPLALSPVVVGLSLYLLYGQDGWFGEPSGGARGIDVLFAVPASCSPRSSSRCRSSLGRSCPRCARSATSRSRQPAPSAPRRRRRSGRSRLPAIRWAVIYGVVLTTARCLGEYGAVAVVSGRVQGETETATLRVEERYQSFDVAGAYAISLVLAATAVLVLIAMTLIKPREEAL